MESSACPQCPWMGAGMMASRRGHDFGRGPMAQAVRFLNDAAFRDSVEAPMTSTQKQTIETDVAQIKSDMATLRGFRPQFQAARQAHDTAALHALMSSTRPAMLQIRSDREAIMAIVAQYHPKAAAGNSMKRPNFALEMRFLRDANFRDSLERPMTVADKDTIETDVTQIKSDIALLKTLRPQMRAAREAQDTARLRALFRSSRPEFHLIRADRHTIIEILERYKSQAGSVQTANLLDPVYPNPVRLGTGPATISYHLTAAGPVTIIVTDAFGNIVEQISKDSQPAGNYTLAVGSSIAKAGAYYVTVIGGGSKSTRKLAIVE